MIELDDNGNFTTDAANHLKTTSQGAVQNAKCELRCLQGTWDADPFYGRNALVWGISQSTNDRSADINRITAKYCNVVSVDYETETKTYSVQVA